MKIGRFLATEAVEFTVKVKTSDVGELVRTLGEFKIKVRSVTDFKNKTSAVVFCCTCLGLFYIGFNFSTAISMKALQEDMWMEVKASNTVKNEE